MENGPEKQDLEFSEEERQIQELFRYFCRKITIKERKMRNCSDRCFLTGSKNIWWNFVNNEQKTGRRRAGNCRYHTFKQRKEFDFARG